MAMQRVEQHLLKVTAALNDAGIRYAVIGGNAVAVLVGKAYEPKAVGGIDSAIVEPAYRRAGIRAG